MLEANAEPPADGGQIVPLLPPVSAGQLHRAEEGERRHRQAGRGATRAKHTTIERGVVGREKRRAVEDREKLRPRSDEGWLVFHHLPGNAMNRGKNDVPSWRPEQHRLPANHRQPLDANQPHRTGAVGTVIGSLEVDGDKGVVARQLMNRV